MLVFYYGELFSRTLPAFVFLVATIVRYYEIEPIAVTKTTSYSTMFKVKVLLQAVLGLVEILTIVFYFQEPPADHPLNYVFEKRGVSFVLLINVIAWAVAAWLLAYEYKRGLSEAFYTHWFFWTIMLLDDVVFFGINFTLYVSIPFLSCSLRPCIS